jgi:hypothetical protein
MFAAPFVPIPPLKDELQLTLSDALGRKVTIESARLTLIGGRYVTLTGMSVHESPVFGEGVFLRADTVRADIDIIRYLRTRRLVIDSLTLLSPKIDLIKDANGVWSWTTIGKQPTEQATLSRISLNPAIASPLLAVLSLWDGNLPTPAFQKINIENASVRLIDRTGSRPPEARYNNIDFTASLASCADEVGTCSQAKGEVVAQSEDDGEAVLFKTALPFDLKIERGSPSLSINGSIGPGRIETRNMEVGAFSITGEVHSAKDGALTGKGQMSANQMFIRTVNLSERVARALKVDQIGDMSLGTRITSLETDFQISQDAIHTPGLRIHQLDGLGDATTEKGSFKIESALTVNYVSTVIMSADATLRLKQISPMVGVLLTILETNNRISVPISISGDVRKPEIKVDVSRIF